MTDQATQEAPTLPDHKTAVAGQVERSVSRPQPERVPSCEYGCNGCELCCDYEADQQ